MWNAIQAANLFKIARETVRQYSREFEVHLSPQANPGKNRTRTYTESDMEIFALIVELKGQGKLYSDIHAAILNGQRGRLPDEISALTTDQPRYTQLQLKINFLEDELSTAHKSIDKRDGQIELLTRQLEDTQDELRRIDRENAVLKYRLEASIKPPP